MPASVRLPEVLRSAAGAPPIVQVEAGSVGSVLTALEQRFSGLGERLTDASGLVRHLNVYVHGRDVRFGAGLAEIVADGDVVMILPVGAP